MIRTKTPGFSLIFVMLLIMLMQIGRGQDIDLDNYFPGSGAGSIDNLGQSLSMGMGGTELSGIKLLNPLQINLSLGKTILFVPASLRSGPLEKTNSYTIPAAHVEMGLPFNVHLVGRIMQFKLGNPTAENALLWGIGMRYLMLQETRHFSGGVLVLYQELNQLSDFDLVTFTIKAFLGVKSGWWEFYGAPALVRSNYHLHFGTEASGLRETHIHNMFKLQLGVRYNVSRRLGVWMNGEFSDYNTLSLGGSVVIF